MKYKVMIDEILKKVGDKENINSLSHCMTRLRVVVKDDSKVNVDGIKKIDGVIDCIHKNDQYQIVIGPKVTDVYKEFSEYIDMKNDDPNTESEQSQEKKSIINRIFDTIASVFIPLIGVLAGSGMIRALLIVLSQGGVLQATSQTYKLLYMFSDSVFYFMPIILAFTAAKRFKCDPFLAVVLGGVLLHPTFTTLVTAGEPLNLIGLPVTLASYSNTFLPILMIVYLQSLVEKFIQKICPKIVAIFLVPMLVILIVAPIGLIVLGPIGEILGKSIAFGLGWLDIKYSWLVPALMGTFFPLLVLTGTHHGLFSAQLIQFNSVGYGTIYIPGAMSANMATAGAVLAVALRSKNKETKSIALSSGVSAICGITEPALYGINVKLKTPLIATMIGGGVAGLFAGITRVKTFALGGTNIFSLPIYINEENNFLLACAMILIAITVAFTISFVFYKEPQNIK
nr:PTS transporter subunit EIIC [uncultured Trichococcus sp.]